MSSSDDRPGLFAHRARLRSLPPAAAGKGHPLLAVPFYLLLLTLGLASLAWNLAAVLLLALLPRRAGQAVGRMAISGVYRACWSLAQMTGLMRIDSRALDALNAEPGGLVVAANHPSMVDALLLVARLRRGVCIMKASLVRNPFLGTGARLARYICNDSARELVRRAVDSLREGGQLVIFPEGTRTEEGRLNRLRPGITLIARRAGVPIQTVIIETDSPYLRKGWPIWRVPPLPMVFTLRLGERFIADDDHAGGLDRLESYFRKELGS